MAGLIVKTYQSFQFHLVRLKAANVPNGSPSAAFQFHLVRLKALRTYTEGLFAEFQFHLVRLKVLQKKKMESDPNYFNSI